MKSLLTHYHGGENDSSADKNSMFIYEGSQNDSFISGNDLHKRPAGRYNSTLLSGNGTNRNQSQLSDNQIYGNANQRKGIKGSERVQLEQYIANLEFEVKNMREQLKKAHKETRAMKQINKELLD